MSIEIESYDEWLDNNQEELSILFSETGTDREIDFDFEREAEKLYNKYLDELEK